MLTQPTSMEYSQEKTEWDIRSRIALLRQENIFSDVTFLVGESEKKFRCHKLILGVGSEVFRAMFYGDIPEEETVHVPDISPEGFENMLEYLYNDKVCINSTIDALDTAYAAKKYLLCELFNRCENYLMTNIRLNSDNVCAVYEQCNFLEMKPLKKKCESFICRNFLAVSSSKSFDSLSKETLEKILMMDLLEVTSECDVIEALMHWGVMQCSISEVKITRKNLRTFVTDLLKHIRFLSITVTQFEALVKKYNFLESPEEIAILLNMALPRNEKFLKMPCGFNASTKQRSCANCSRIRIPLEYRYNDDKNSFTITKHEQSANLKIMKGHMTILGAVFEIKPIAGYLKSHRYLNIDILVQNRSTKTQSKSTVCMKPKKDNNDEEFTQELFFDDPLLFSEEQMVSLNLWLEGEGVQLPQSVQKNITTCIYEQEITIRLSDPTVEKKHFIVKEIMVT